MESPTAFFTAAEAEYADAPAWVGELYLEIHRGTYTSQARTKQGNRRSEHLLREAELWAATAAVRGLRPTPPRRSPRRGAPCCCTSSTTSCPGSSIAWVHREAVDTYAEVAATLESVIDSATTALAGDGTDEVAFNAGPVPRAACPPWVRQRPGRPRRPVPVRDGDDVVLDNGLLRVRVDRDGLVRSVLDLVHDREVVPPGGAAARLQLHPDTPNAWDAWDLDGFYRHSVRDLDVTSTSPTTPSSSPTTSAPRPHGNGSRCRATRRSSTSRPRSTGRRARPC